MSRVVFVITSLVDCKVTFSVQLLHQQYRGRGCVWPYADFADTGGGVVLVRAKPGNIILERSLNVKTVIFYLHKIGKA